MPLIAKRLNSYREERKLSIRGFAEILDIPFSTLDNWLKGKNEPKATDIIKICEKLNVSADWLIGLIEQHTEKHNEVYKEFNVDGIEWIELKPSNSLDTNYQKHISEGIEYFHKLIFTQKQTREIGNWQRIYTSIKIALQSNHLTIKRIARNYLMEEHISTLFPHIKGKVVIAKLPKKGSIDTNPVRAEFVAHLAATEALPKTDKVSNRIGIGAGYTMLRFAQLTSYDEKFAQLTWIPLMSFRDGLFDNYGLSANSIVTTLAQRHPNTKSLSIPYLDDEQRELFEQGVDNLLTKKAKSVFYQLKQAFPLFLSVSGGTPMSSDGKVPGLPFYTSDYSICYEDARETYQKISNRKIIGCEILGMLLDTNGNLIEEHDIKAYFGIDIPTLREIVELSDVWCVAARPHKAHAVFTAIKNKLVNGLVIDDDIAEYLIQHSG